MKYNLANSSVPIDSLHGKSRTALEQSWSVIVRMELYPKEGGNFVIQSIAIVLNGAAPSFGVIG